MTTIVPKVLLQMILGVVLLFRDEVIDILIFIDIFRYNWTIT